MADVKFSQFTDGDQCKVGDIVVGLRGGVNYKFDFPDVGFKDANGNYLLQYATAGAAAVNYPLITNSLTTVKVIYGAAGTDSNIGITIAPKGTGEVNIPANVIGVTQLNVDNLRLDGNTISSTNTNGNISVIPDGTGSLLVGSATSLVTGWQAQIASNSIESNLVLGSFVNSSTGSSFYGYKSRSTTVGGVTAVASGDILLNIYGFGTDGTSYAAGTLIRSKASAAVSTGVVPGQLEFYTANTSGVLTLALTVNNAQQSTFAGLITSSNGINFGGSTLANYVTAGTWSPTFSFATPGDLSVVYGTRVGLYTRIGNIVTVSLNLTCTPTFTTSAGALAISGFPIALAATSGNQTVSGILTAGFAYPALVTQIYGYLPASATSMQTYGVTATGTNPQVGVAQFTSGVQVSFNATFTYLV